MCRICTADNTSHTAKDIMGIKVKGIQTRVPAPGRRKVKFIVYIHTFFFSFSLFFFAVPLRAT